MERENNMREFKTIEEEDTPKFGAGSEYNRDMKEEARRKKFGIISRKYDPDKQPW
jgi:transcription initiation factor TFIIF subunit alpha